MTNKIIGSVFAILAATTIVASPVSAAPRHAHKRQVCKIVKKGHGKHQKRVRTCRWVRR